MPFCSTLKVKKLDFSLLLTIRNILGYNVELGINVEGGIFGKN